MRLSHIAIAVFLMIIWGVQFTSVHIATEVIPPYTLCCLRFFFTAFPLIFFLKRPQASFKLVILYGLFTFALQYTLFFTAMRLQMPAGIASLLYQSQVLMNIGLAYFFFKERITLSQLIGILIAFVGLGMIGFNLGTNGVVSPTAFFLTILSTFVWALGNMASKKAGAINVLSLVVWGNAIAFVPLIFVAWYFEGPSQMIRAWHEASFATWVSVIYIVYFSTVLAFSIWSWLLSLYPVKNVVPFMLLAPVFGMLCACWVLHEPLPLWKIEAACLIVGGLCVNFFGEQLRKLTKSDG